MGKLFKFSILTSAFLIFISTASAQYVISTRAGLVNYTTRDVSVKRADGAIETVKTGLQLESGDTIDAKGRVEILLNPGSFLRLEAGTILTLTETAFTDMHFSLQSGVALIEANDIGRNGVSLELGTSQGTVKFLKDGLYRISTQEQGGAVLAVRSGEAEVETLAGQPFRVKHGHQATISGESTTMAKVSKDFDDFESWGQSRAQSMALLNQRERTISGLPDYNSVGLLSGSWYFDRFYSSYCFFPFASYNYWSPFGFWYPTYIYPIFRPAGYPFVTGGGKPTGTGTGTGVATTTTTPTHPIVSLPVVHRPRVFAESGPSGGHNTSTVSSNSSSFNGTNSSGFNSNSSNGNRTNSSSGRTTSTASSGSHTSSGGGGVSHSSSPPPSVGRGH